MKLTAIERAALLKCRYAGRYDNLGDPNRKRMTREESAEEQAASFVRTDFETFERLIVRGLLVRPWADARMRLTEEGRKALATQPESADK